MPALVTRGTTPLVALGLAALCASIIGCQPPAPEGGPDGGVPTRALGESCSSSEDCMTGLCIEVAPGRSVCTQQCNVDGDCPAGDSWGCILPERFEARVCGCAASSAEEICGDGLDNECNGRADDCRICAGVPVPEDDPRHCGGCFIACRGDQECGAGACRCPAGLSECDGLCVDLSSDDESCGACGNACPAGASCIAGACDCPSGSPNQCGDACTNLRTDSANCGECGNVCGPGLACSDGECRCSDETFFLHCPGIGCVDPLTDERGCGTCATTCPSAQQCVVGLCECPTPGQALCDGACIDVRTDPANCGACDRACRVGERCQGGTCTCDSGLVCGGTCVGTVDPANCGGCGVTCRADQRCTGAGGCQCGVLPNECGGACVDFRTDETNCGGCGLTCPASQVCNGGRCACPVFGTTYCAALGACVDLRSDEANCGGCGVTCPAAQICSGSACACPLSGTTFCAATGTCVDLRTDEASCGACGNVCPAAQTCTSSVCRCPSSASTFCTATNTCVDTQNDEANCGTCGNVCPGSTTCQFGSCRCPLSSQQYCASAGACVDLSSDDAHCGACDNVCPAATSCGFYTCACDTPGLSVCGTSCVDRQTDEANCGACGRVCSGGRECLSGSCLCPSPAPGGLVRMTSNATRSETVRLASDGTRVAAVWSETSTVTTDSNVRFALLDAAGARVAGTEVALATGVTGSPDVVWSGTVYGVAWTQTIGTERHAMFQRFDADGLPLGAPINVTDPWPGTSTRIDTVRLAWAPGSGFGMLVRPASSEVYFQGLGADASTLPLPVRLAETLWGSTSTPWDIAGASDGRFAMLYGSYVQVVNADGSITVPSVSLSSVSPIQLAWDGTTWVVAATRSLYVSSSYRAQVILLRGPTLSTIHVVYDALASTVSLRDVAIAIDSGVAEVVWTDDTDSSGSRRLRIARARLPATGVPFTVISPPTLLMADYTVASDLGPVVTHVGTTQLMTAWSDTRWGQYEIYLQAATVGVCM